MEDLGYRKLPGDGPAGGPIRILQLTDLHHFPAGCVAFDVRAAKGRVVPIGAGTPYSTKRDLAVISSILARVRPHLVVLTGDIIDARPFGAGGEPAGGAPQAQAWRQCMLEVLAPVVAAGCAWTYVPGNHDDDGGPWTREALLGVYQLGAAAPGCISAGATCFNHTLAVGHGPRVVPEESLRLWLFDSGGNHPDPAVKYHTFSSEAVVGFRRLSASLPRAACDLAYFHIPLPQAGALAPVQGRSGLFDAALRSGAVPRPWRWPPFTQAVRLLGRDRVVSASRLESGMFEALAAGRVQACFFGHDHQNDAVFRRAGLYMAYGRVGGTTPPIDWEGDAGPLPFEVGARVVAWVPPCGPLRTWIELAGAMEEGSELQMGDHGDGGLAGARCAPAPGRQARAALRPVLLGLALALLWWLASALGPARGGFRAASGAVLPSRCLASRSRCFGGAPPRAGASERPREQ